MGCSESKFCFLARWRVVIAQTQAADNLAAVRTITKFVLCLVCPWLSFKSCTATKSLTNYDKLIVIKILLRKTLMKADFILKLKLVTIKNLHWRCNLISHAIQCWGIYIIWIFRQSIFWNLLSIVGRRLDSLSITDITSWMFDQPLFILRVQHHRSFYHPSLCFFYKQHSFHCENQPLWRIVSYEWHITKCDFFLGRTFHCTAVVRHYGCANTILILVHVVSYWASANVAAITVALPVLFTALYQNVT